MIEFFKKNYQNITAASAGVLLLICYFQQRELARLRKENLTIKEIKVDKKSLDSLLIKKGLK